MDMEHLEAKQDPSSNTKLASIVLWCQCPVVTCMDFSRHFASQLQQAMAWSWWGDCLGKGEHRPFHVSAVVKTRHNWQVVHSLHPLRTAAGHIWAVEGHGSNWDVLPKGPVLMSWLTYWWERWEHYGSPLCAEFYVQVLASLSPKQQTAHVVFCRNSFALHMTGHHPGSHRKQCEHMCQRPHVRRTQCI